VRYAARRDANDHEILRALQQVGARVLRLEPIDFLVYFRGRLYMLDVKTPKGRATMTQDALARGGWPLHYVHDAHEALRAIGALP
jgi:hypothetical protein